MQSDECKCAKEFLLKSRRNKIKLEAVYSFRIAMLCFTTYFILLSMYNYNDHLCS